MNPRRAKLTPIRVWNTTPRDGSASLTGVRGVTDDPGCVWVLLDGVRAGVVDRETAVRLGLGGAGPSRAWTEDLAGRIDEEVRRRLCERSAVRLLAARMRCRAGLVRALTQRGHDQRTAEACADRYAALGALDDARFAEVVVRNELARKPAGRRLLEAKLRAQGVGGDTAGKAIAAALRGRDELEDARKVAAASLRGMRANADADAVRRRLSGRLARRGFSGEVVRRAVDEVLGGGGR